MSKVSQVVLCAERQMTDPLKQLEQVTRSLQVESKKPFIIQGASWRREKLALRTDIDSYEC